MRAFERFLQYVNIYTRSDEASEDTPSTPRQFDLARLLVTQLRELGVTDAQVDARCYVYASLPATPGCEGVPAVGFIAHMDTADYEAAKVKPLLHTNYDGKDVQLRGCMLSTAMFPHLKQLKGQTLITTDGTTLLGADDKAGIAEIMTMVQKVQQSGRPHGKLCIGFTPDEEIGRGADWFDVEAFGAQYAYTVDGGRAGEIEYENFNACVAEITIRGVDVHPGSAKDIMVNALLVAMELHAMLPQQTPRNTEGLEGFYHLMRLEGDPTSARMRYIIRDHDAEGFARRQRILRRTAQSLDARWGAGTVELQLRQQYRNMAEIIRKHPRLIDSAIQAARKVGLEPGTQPIRGGTDGANLSFKGLPCPNLGTGGFAFHGPFEHITVEAMDQVSDMLVGLATEEFL